MRYVHLVITQETFTALCFVVPNEGGYPFTSKIDRSVRLQNPLALAEGTWSHGFTPARHNPEDYTVYPYNGHTIHLNIKYEGTEPSITDAMDFERIGGVYEAYYGISTGIYKWLSKL